MSSLTAKQWQRFKSIKRGYWSALVLAVLLVLSVAAELLVNSRALLVSYQGKLYFPTYGAVIPGKTFGLDYEYETNYRELKQHFQQQGQGNWVLLPLVPYNPYENDLTPGQYPPTLPSWEKQHYLGTDTSGRDVVARLVYGFRIVMTFSLALLFCSYFIGISIGSLMGFVGGKLDLIGQRLIEIWSNLPFLYVIMIVASIILPSFAILLIIMVLFNWGDMTWYMRTATYKEKSREYVLAAKAQGAGALRIVFKHILPNRVATIVTFVPFAVAAGITAVTSLDYLGFGLPPPTPSWGELLGQGTRHLEAGWLVGSVVTAMVLVLVMVTFVGEAIREAFDPKQHTYYN
jgi:microcin C transport system permease protein